MDNTYTVAQALGAAFTSQNSSAGSTLSPETSLELSDFFEFNDWIDENDPAFLSFTEEYGHLQNPVFTTSHDTEVNSTEISISNKFHDDGIMNNGDSGSGKEKKEIRDKVAFRTKSQIEILDDGFKWRKYGKKMVKNSPNPRNYFKCSVEGCPVKKRVERDKDDPHYVVTTYEGIHNHQGPYL
ncbi:probable WRKY transcription factor 75 [Primulina huaijiensis]|uniref:probable WRKY transcription factor 75 n=1 Tax=Primulina huaijiensis TaxID=1492673 RepID=UPI003CC78A4A